MAPKKKAAEPVATEDAAATKKAKSGLAVGDMLPEFEVETDEGETITSTDIVKEHGAVFFFYPKANTGGCTTQACGFRDNYDKFLSKGYKIYGFSADKPKSQANWKTKHSFQYNLLCDPSFEVLKTLGVAKGGKSISRSHIVVEKGGKVVDIQYGISPKESVAEAVKFVVGDEKEAEAAADAAEKAGAAEPEPAEAPEPAAEEADESKGKGKKKAAAKGKGKKK